MKRLLFVIMISVLVLSLYGCSGSKNKSSKDRPDRKEAKEDKEQSVEGDDMETPDPADDGNKEPEEDPDIYGDEKLSGKAGLKQAYTDALWKFENDHILPDGQDVSEDIMDGDDFSENTFSVYDVDGDGEEELVIFFTSTYHAGYLGCIYGYDDETGELYEELTAYPVMDFYKYGFLKEMAYSNQGLSGDFWPYTIHKYDPDKRAYEAIAYIEAWDGKNFPKDMDGNKFPARYDRDGDGMIYYLYNAGSTSEPINEEPYDYDDLRKWLLNNMCIEDEETGYTYQSYRITIPWQSFTDKNIRAYEKGDSIITAFDKAEYTQFTLKDMTFWLPNDYLDKVIVKKSDDYYTFYHKKSAEAWKKDYPEEEFLAGYLFSVTALNDSDEVDYSESFDYLGSSPSSDGKTEYYNYVVFTPTDWPPYGDAESYEEYADIYNQYEDIHEEIKDCIKFPKLPNYVDDDYDMPGENDYESVNRSLDKGKSSNADMLAAYGKIASQKEYSYENEMGTFALHDLNNDGVPELIIDSDGLIVSDNLYFTYSGNEVVELDASELSFPAWGSLLSSSGSGSFCFYRGGPAYTDEKEKDVMPHVYIEYTIRKDKIVEGDTYNGLYYREDDTWKCTKNGKKLRTPDFLDFVNSMDGKVEFVDNTAENRAKAGLE
ncbi:MAG: hypothetical protein IKP31_03355 [Lachnospiraceae bacterium]|nr:hypothetical protein [Lachnospiraceae bacterium]